MKPTIGRIVHYQHPMEIGSMTLPAIIVNVWSDVCVNLQVFTDGRNSHPGAISGVEWVTSVTMDEFAKQPRTWHWPGPHLSQ